uniref:Beta-secretase 2 n=1 Tax=Anas zonorhyncha TaxID=75864 RepID=A0A8B9VBJ7_9AVES
MNSHTDTWTHGHRHPTARIPGGPGSSAIPPGLSETFRPGAEPPSFSASASPPAEAGLPERAAQLPRPGGRRGGARRRGVGGDGAGAWGSRSRLPPSPPPPSLLAGCSSPAPGDRCLPAEPRSSRDVPPGWGRRRSPPASCCCWPAPRGCAGLSSRCRSACPSRPPPGGRRPPRCRCGRGPAGAGSGMPRQSREAWPWPRSPGAASTFWPWWTTCRGTPAAGTTWRCSSGPRRRRSSTYKSQGIDVTVKYSQGSWTGVLGVQWHGILGLAYGTLAKPSSSVETFFDSLVRQAKIPNIFSLQMCGAGLPVSGSGTNGGSLVLGGIEPSLYRGDIWYTPIKEEWYYQVEILKLEVGGQNLELDCREYNADKAIVDSGTTLLRLPQKVFSAVVQAIARKSLVQEFSSGFWTGTQLACWDKTERPWSLFPKLSIYMRDENSSRSFRISILPQLYIQPILGIGENLQCYRFGISSSANALVIGATVMEGFYVIFDRAQRRVGFAVSPCAEVDGSPVSEIEGPFTTEDVASNCVSVISFHEPVLWIASYALMSLCGIILLALIILLLIPPRCQHRYTDNDVVNDESSLVRHRWK